MLIGGMPQAVSEYIATNNFKQVDAIKRGILKLYEDDFARIDRTGRLALLFDNIPAQLNQNSSRYHVSAVLQNYRAGEILELVAQLRDSGTVLVSYHTADPNVGLTSTIDLTKFKLFLSDTGLFTTLMFKDRDFTENIIYEKLLSDKLSANLGYLYKNVVAQMLTAKGDRLFYHTFRNEENNRSFEIDFLISRQHKICPVEVKSSGYLKHSSLNAFCSKFSSRILRKYLINTKAPAKDLDVECLPPYMVPFL
jgi:predicted AAA+ superfamily ATPase